MPKAEIREMRQFLEKCLNRTVIEYKLADLIKPGDNYASIIQALEVTVANAEDKVCISILRKCLQKCLCSIYTNAFFKARSASYGR